VREPLNEIARESRERERAREREKSEREREGERVEGKRERERERGRKDEASCQMKPITINYTRILPRKQKRTHVDGSPSVKHLLLAGFMTGLAYCYGS